MPKHKIDVAAQVFKPSDLDGLRQALCHSFAILDDDIFANLIARLERVEGAPTVFARTDQ